MKLTLKSQISLLAAGLLLAAIPHAKAVAILGFDDAAGGSGTMSYNGEGGALVGSNILIDRITGTGTPLNSGTQLTVTNGALNFSTGSNLSEAGPWTFNGGGTFVVTGNVFNGVVPVASGTLLTGTFTGTPTVTSGSGAAFATFSGFGIDSKNRDLLAFFGITATDFVFANTEISGAITAAQNGGFSVDVVNSDINNTARVPDGGSAVLLLAFALFGVEGFRRKFFA